MTATIPTAALHSPEWFNQAFAATSPSVQADLVPPELRALSETLCREFNIRGVCDPMYIVNRAAIELGMGNGQGKFTSQQVPTDAVVRVPAIVDFMQTAYSTCIGQSMGSNVVNAKDRIREILLAALPVLSAKESVPLPYKKSTLAINTNFRRACRLVLNYAWEHQIEVSPLVIEERYSGTHSFSGPGIRSGGIFAVQFMVESAPRLSRVLPESMRNIATFVVDMNSMKTFETFLAPGRPYTQTENSCRADATEEFARALADKFPDSPMLVEQALEYDRYPEGDGPSAQQARLELISRMIGAQSILTVMQVLNVKLPADADVDEPAAPGI